MSLMAGRCRDSRLLAYATTGGTGGAKGRRDLLNPVELEAEEHAKVLPR